MNQNKDFYKKLDVNRLIEYASLTGLDGDIPVDYLIFKDLIGERKSVLEVGCAYGRLGGILNQEYEYVGIDTSAEYIDLFKNSTEGEIEIINDEFLEYSFDKKFDIVLFPWSVIEDFTKENQERAIINSLELLNEGGLIILDNPAPGAEFNTVEGYVTTKFYYEEWVSFFNKNNFKKIYKKDYKTKTGRERQVVVLEK